MSVREGAVPLRLGKIGAEEFERAVAPHLGAARAEVLVGPGLGTDAAVIRIGAGRVISVTSDPLSFLPGLGPERSAKLACHLLASDAWTSGIPPAYATLSFHLPPGLEQADVASYMRAMHAECERLGIAIVAGHTGRYEGCGLTIIGAGTLIGIGDEGRTVGPGFVGAGDRVIVSKGCAFEAAAIAAHLFPGRLAERLDEEGLARARSWLEHVSVVEDCRVLLQLGVRDRGITCLHDATEGGILGGLVELSRAIGKDVRVERSRIPLLPEAQAACEALGADPYWTLSSGSLIATVRPERADEAVQALLALGFPAANVGEVVGGGSGKLWLALPDGSVQTLAEPEPDPYWEAYGRAVREDWH